MDYYPKLIENSTKHYLGETLSQFHEKRQKFNSIILNCLVLIMFLVSLEQLCIIIGKQN